MTVPQRLARTPKISQNSFMFHSYSYSLFLQLNIVVILALSVINKADLNIQKKILELERRLSS